MKTIADFQIVDHGIDGDQYFQGCGLSFTSFEDIATGIGSNPYEALDDALENLAQGDWDTESNPELNEELRIFKQHWDGKDCLPEPEEDEDGEPYDSEMHYYISVRVK